LEQELRKVRPRTKRQKDKTAAQIAAQELDELILTN
jgi:hypothetical protein